MKVSVKGGALRFCTDCESTHMGRVPCGMSYAQRLRSQTTDPSWMPARRAVGNLKNYYDDESVSALFNDGLTGKERKEQMLDETEGVGVASAEEVAKYPELAAAHYLDNPRDV